MKTLICILLYLLASIFPIYTATPCSCDKSHYLFNLMNDIDDSTRELLRDRKCLIFVRGYMGKDWSVVLEQDNGYTILSSGSVDKLQSKPRIDRLDGYCPLLSFIMDPINSQLINLHTEPFDLYDPLYMELFLLSEQDDVILKFNHNQKYQGDNATWINEVISKIMYFMYWYSCSEEERRKLPVPELCSSLNSQVNDK